MIWKTPNRNHRTQPRNDDTAEEEIKTFTIESKAEQVTQQGNRIYFFNEVNRDNILSLIKQLDDVTRQMIILKMSLDLAEPPPIHLYICSEGGEITPAISAADHIKNNKVPVYTYIEGSVASAATLLSVVGKKRFMSKNGSMLIHQLSSAFWGKYYEFEDEMKNLNLWMDTIKRLYNENTEIPINEMDELLKHDLYMPPDVCLAWKMIDEII